MSNKPQTTPEPVRMRGWSEETSPDYRGLLRQVFYARLPLGNKVEDHIAVTDDQLWRGVHAALNYEPPPIPGAELICEECAKAITTGVHTQTGVVCSDCSDEVLDPPLPPLTSAPAELACVRCGCTELVACDGGCSWACESVNICSACVPLHLVPLFDEIRRLEEMVESAAELLSGRVDAAHAILKGDGV